MKSRVREEEEGGAPRQREGRDVRCALFTASSTHTHTQTCVCVCACALPLRWRGGARCDLKEKAGCLAGVCVPRAALQPCGSPEVFGILTPSVQGVDCCACLSFASRWTPPPRSDNCDRVVLDALECLHSLAYHRLLVFFFYDSIRVLHTHTHTRTSAIHGVTLSPSRTVESATP